MGIFKAGERSESHASGLSRLLPHLSDDHTVDGSHANEIIAEEADHGSPPAPMRIEPSAYAASIRTPGRSFYHRSFHSSIGTAIDELHTYVSCLFP